MNAASNDLFDYFLRECSFTRKTHSIVDAAFTNAQKLFSVHRFFKRLCCFQLHKPLKRSILHVIMLPIVYYEHGYF